MNKTKRLHVLLALTDHLRHKYKNMVLDYSKFFKNSQGAFKGEKNTYAPREGTIDIENKRKFVKVVTTVDEKIDYFIENSKDFVDALFSQEKTNASGNAVAELIVEDQSWGVFTSNELLRLRSVLESADYGNIGEMMKNIPVRSDADVWERSKDENYKDRLIWEQPIRQGVQKTTINTPYILPDPNLVGNEYPANYHPQVANKQDVFELGDYTQQVFSGEWSHTKKAHALKRRDTLLAAVCSALKIANECEVVKSELTAETIYKYVFYGDK